MRKTTVFVARLIAPAFGSALGVPVEVENMPGDSGQKAAAHVAHAAPDGRTLLLDASSFSVNPSLFAKLPYDSDAAFSVLGVLAVFPNVLVCHPSFEASTVADLIRMAKAKPDEIAFASSGNGSAQHLAGALFEDLAHVSLKHVPYKGGGPALADVVAGKVPLFFANVASSRDQLQSGKLRALAVTSRRRTKVLAQAIAESPAFSIAGGGDTLAAIDKYGVGEQISYISTGGGAFLEFVEGKVLPAVEVLEQRAK